MIQSLIQLQTLLKLHTPRIPQHHIKAFPSPKPHNMLHIQSSPMQVTGEGSPERVRVTG